MKRIVLEALVVGLLGAVIAFGANALSPHGLKLARNYFPGDRGPNVVPSTGGGTNLPGPPAVESAATRLRQKGLEVVDGEGAQTLFNDPRYQQGLVIFIDARPDHNYQEGHIPGAYQFNHYEPEKYLPTVLPACQPAQQIVVYCGGGSCEDSEFAAMMLRDTLGIAREKLLVYVDGITEWKAKGRPIEGGARNSGLIQKPIP